MGKVKGGLRRRVRSSARLPLDVSPKSSQRVAIVSYFSLATKYAKENLGHLANSSDYNTGVSTDPMLRLDDHIEVSGLASSEPI